MCAPPAQRRLSSSRKARGSRNRMKNFLGSTFWATGALVLAAAAACGSSEADPSPPTASSSSPTASSTSASPTTSTDSAAAQVHDRRGSADADASATMKSYFQVLDELRTDPSTDLK